MKKIFFALTFFIVLVLSSATAFAYESWIERECPKEADVKLVFMSSYGKLHYKYKTSDFLRQSSTTPRKENERVLGLTLPHTTVEVNITTSVIGSSMSDEVCVVPETVEVFFGFVNPDIYISYDLKDKKCQRALIVRHEQTHQQINVLALNYFLPQMKKLIRKKVDKLKPVVAYKWEQESVVQQMNETIMQRMNNLVNQFNAFLDKEQSKLDNDENYAFEATVCP